MNDESHPGGPETCPTCQPAPMLSPASGPLGASTCPWCGGGLVPPARLAAFRAALAEAGPATSALSAVAIRCPSCGASAQRFTLAAGNAAQCAGCRSVWVDAPLLAWAEARLRGMASAFAPERAAPAPAPPPMAPPAATRFTATSPPRARTIRASAVVTAVVLAIIVVGGVAALVRRIPSAEAAAPTEPQALERSVEEAVAAPAPGAPTPAPAARERQRVEPLYGGRTLAWWGQRLEELRSASDEARRGLYQATVERAEANGLEVTVTAAGVQVAAGRAEGGPTEARP